MQTFAQNFLGGCYMSKYTGEKGKANLIYAKKVKLTNKDSKK